METIPTEIYEHILRTEPDAVDITIAGTMTVGITSFVCIMYADAKGYWCISHYRNICDIGWTYTVLVETEEL